MADDREGGTEDVRMIAYLAVKSVEQGLGALRHASFPILIEPAFTLDGAGRCLANSLEEYRKLLQEALDLSPVNEVQISWGIERENR